MARIRSRSRRDPLEIEWVEILEPAAGQVLVRVAGSWCATPPSPTPATELVIGSASDAPRVAALPRSSALLGRAGSDPAAFRVAFAVPAALASELAGDLRLALEDTLVVLPPPGRPSMPEADASGAEVIDRAELAERRARRAEQAQQTSAQRADHSASAAEDLEVEVVRLEARLQHAVGEQLALEARLSAAQDDARAALAQRHALDETGEVAARRDGRLDKLRAEFRLARVVGLIPAQATVHGEWAVSRDLDIGLRGAERALTPMSRRSTAAVVPADPRLVGPAGGGRLAVSPEIVAKVVADAQRWRARVNELGHERDSALLRAEAAEATLAGQQRSSAQRFAALEAAWHQELAREREALDSQADRIASAVDLLREELREAHGGQLERDARRSEDEALIVEMMGTADAALAEAEVRLAEARAAAERDDLTERPAGHPAKQEDRQIRSEWLSLGLTRLVRIEPDAAIPLLTGLLALQATADAPIDYDLVLRGGPTIGVMVGAHGAQLTVLQAPRPRAQVDFRVETNPAALALLLTEGVRTRSARRGLKVTKARKRRALTRLGPVAVQCALQTDTLILDDRALHAALSSLIEPDWTRGRYFSVLVEIVGDRQRCWHAVVRDGERVRVCDQAGADGARATARFSQSAFRRFLVGAPALAGDRPEVRGDLDALASLASWSARARSQSGPATPS